MLVRLIYASRSTSPINDETVARILAQISEKHNLKMPVSPACCASVTIGDVFMQ